MGHVRVKFHPALASSLWLPTSSTPPHLRVHSTASIDNHLSHSCRSWRQDTMPSTTPVRPGIWLAEEFALQLVWKRGCTLATTEIEGIPVRNACIRGETLAQIPRARKTARKVIDQMRSLPFPSPPHHRLFPPPDHPLPPPHNHQHYVLAPHPR